MKQRLSGGPYSHIDMATLRGAIDKLSDLNERGLNREEFVQGMRRGSARRMRAAAAK